MKNKPKRVIKDRTNKTVREILKIIDRMNKEEIKNKITDRREYVNSVDRYILRELYTLLP